MLVHTFNSSAVEASSSQPGPHIETLSKQQTTPLSERRKKEKKAKLDSNGIPWRYGSLPTCEALGSVCYAAVRKQKAEMEVMKQLSSLASLA